MSAGICSHMANSETAIAATLEVIAAARAGGGRVRALGGVAIALRCPTAHSGQPLARSYSDMDLITTRESGPVLACAMKRLGYLPAERFNLLHGRTRMMFDHSNGLHADVFVDEFAMCHRLNLSSRLELHETTISLADLLLTKLQVAELNEKDVMDSAALLLDHEFGGGLEEIDAGVITDLVGNDWGWWRTVSQNLRTFRGHVSRLRLSAAAAGLVDSRAAELLEFMEVAPKSFRWKLRAKAGDRIAWREDPEESR